jgi:hypothetical protein
MTRFEFASVLVSIVLAFALSEILAAWGREIKYPHQLSVSGPYTLVSIWLGLSIIMHWFGLWSYREVHFDRAFNSFVVLCPALAIALVSDVLSPELEGSNRDQLDQHYFRVRR